MLHLDEHILARYEGDEHVRLLNCWFAIYSRPCIAIPIAEDQADPLVKALAGQREKLHYQSGFTTHLLVFIVHTCI